MLLFQLKVTGDVVSYRSRESNSCESDQMRMGMMT